MSRRGPRRPRRRSRPGIRRNGGIEAGDPLVSTRRYGVHAGHVCRQATTPEHRRHAVCHHEAPAVLPSQKRVMREREEKRLVREAHQAEAKKGNYILDSLTPKKRRRKWAEIIDGVLQ